jgi:transposase-like protein
MGTRRRFSREFKVEAVKLVCERRVAVAQAAREEDKTNWAAVQSWPTRGSSLPVPFGHRCRPAPPRFPPP